MEISINVSLSSCGSGNFCCVAFVLCPQAEDAWPRTGPEARGLHMGQVLSFKSFKRQKLQGIPGKGSAKEKSRLSCTFDSDA